MEKIYKAAKLDFILLKYYLKSICFTLFIPLVFVILYRSLMVGVSFAMFLMSMSSIYTFSVAEKNDMQRLYGILPVSDTQLVCGKYLHIFFMGVITLLISCSLQPLILKSIRHTGIPAGYDNLCTGRYDPLYHIYMYPDTGIL